MIRFACWCTLLCSVRLIDSRKPLFIEKIVKAAAAQYESAHDDISVDHQDIIYQDIDRKITEAVPSDISIDSIFYHDDAEFDNINKRKIFQYLEFYYDLYLKLRYWFLYFYELLTTYIQSLIYYYWEVFSQQINICVKYVKQCFEEFAWKHVLFKACNMLLKIFQFCRATLVTIIFFLRDTDFQQIFDIVNPDSRHWLVPVIKVICLFCFVITLVFSIRRDQCIKASEGSKKKEVSGKPVPDGLDNVQIPLDGPKLVIFSGGSAMREMCKKITTNLSRKVTYVLPLSDDGGSSREIIKIIGGPAIGDIRNRLNALADYSTDETCAIKRLLDHRLNVSDLLQARCEINEIIAGEHPLWSYYSLENGTQFIKDAKKQPIISFISHFYESVSKEMKRINQNNNNHNQRGGISKLGISAIIALFNPISYNVIPDSNYNRDFDFRGGSIGNFVLSGARLFMKSLDAAITWYSEIISIPKHTHVLPIITQSSLTERVKICALLSDGNYIYGQSEISHPHDNKSAAVAKLAAGNVKLHSPIKQIFYCDNSKSSNILPRMNSTIIKCLNASETIVYGMGSFYTSIIALLIVPGVGSSIKALSCPKVIMINGYPDRETFDMKLLDFIGSLVGAMKQSEGDTIPISSMFRYLSELGSNEIKKYITHVCYIDAPVVTSTIVSLDQLQILQTLGIKTVSIPPAAPSHLESDPRLRAPSSAVSPHSVNETSNKYCSFPIYDDEKLLLEIKRISENYKNAERKRRSFPEFDN